MQLNNQELTDDLVVDLYLDYKNNCLTVARFAEYYDMPEFIGNASIKQGRKLHIERTEG